jgi:D-glycerate 3-kinase
LNVEAFLRNHRLPDAFAETATHFYAPLAEWVEERLATREGPGFVLGINGAPGTGKSTLSHFLRQYLESEHGRSVVEMSIDDIYQTRAEREALAQSVNPLLVSRGVPGTHDVALGSAVIEGLQALRAGESLAVPRFDKSVDDRAPKSDWAVAHGPVDLIVFEGWCVGSRAEPDDRLSAPINDLEANEDASGEWREHVNRMLGTEYRKLFERLDALVFLEAPNFDAVYHWRLEQEHKLEDAAGRSASGVMSNAEVARFVQHFERITRNNLARLPAIANVVISLGEDHAAVSARYS